MLCRERGREKESIMGEAESLTELVQALEQATLMAKHLPTTVDPTRLHHIYSSLHHAHHRLSSFLSLPSPPPQPQPQPPAPAPEPMQVGDEGEDETEVTSKDPIDNVEERMRDCCIQNKRRKRPLSPSSVVEPRKYAAEVTGFDTKESRLKALDLVYQFHA